jgi:hypothetical protein
VGAYPKILTRALPWVSTHIIFNKKATFQYVLPILIFSLKSEVISIFKTLDDGRIVNSDTGEIVLKQTVYLLPNETFKIINLEKIAISRGVNRHVAKKILDHTLERWKKGYQYTKVFSDTMRIVGKELSPTECKVIMLLMSYIRYDTGMIATLKGNPITNDDIEKIVDMSRKTVFTTMDGLVKKRIFAKNRVGICNQYFANPYIFLRGKYINNTLKAMFKNYAVTRGLSTEGMT